MSNLRPIFLFSLPRSGSTLLQRMLASHSAISTTSEPWLLLPFMYASRINGLHAEYDHAQYVRALEDFCEALPGGRDDYRQALHDFAIGLYRRASSESAAYFLDKTPRYSLIAKEILDVFPESKAIFLWRNPIAVAASMMETWSGGRWNLYRYRVDLFKGLEGLVDVCQQRAGSVVSLKYEDLVSDPDLEIGRLLHYLDLPGSVALTDSFRSMELAGRMGDPPGVHNYDSVSRASIDKWKFVMGNPLRRGWARRYLAWIGDDRLHAMGYSKSEILAALAGISHSYRFLGSDVLRMPAGKVLHAIDSAHSFVKGLGDTDFN